MVVAALRIAAVVPLATLMGAEIADPFTPYLDGKAPEIVRDLPGISGVPGNISLRRVQFRHRDDHRIYAVIATPNSPGPHPGLLVLHGGGGQAEVDKAMAWAQRGYIAVAPDLPGIAEPRKLVETQGPWNTMKYGEGRWKAAPDASASVLFDGVLSAMQSLYLLRAQPGINRQSIGVVGISWGGYMTTMVCGLAGNQVRAGFAVFGCGFYEFTSAAGNLAKLPEAERAAWYAHLDAGRRAPGITAAFFTAGATNDFFFYPKAVQATLDAIPGERNHLYAANANHKVPLPGGMDFPKESAEPFVPSPDQQLPTPTGGKANWLAMEVPYFAYHLKGEGRPLPRIQVVPQGDPRQVAVAITAPCPLTGVTVHWAKADPEVKKRRWTAVPTTLGSDQLHHATLPAEAVEWFATASDDRPVTVSSDLVSVTIP